MPDPGQFHFLRPLWLLALPPLVVLGWWLAHRVAARSAWQQVVDPALLPHLLDGAPGERSGGAWLPALVLGALVVAAAGPTWERLPQPVVQSAEPLVIVWDLSLSMYARDVEPSRLVRARYRIDDVLGHRADSPTALVVYAGDAHVVAPLTDDVRTIRNLLPALEPVVMPEFGSRARAGLELAGDLLLRAGGSGSVLLVTDGIDRLTDVTEALPAAIPISVLGVGTVEGAPIPMDFADRPGEWFKDAQGLTVVAGMDAARLRLAADLAGGRYYGLHDNLAALGSDPAGAATLAVADSQGLFDTWLDRGPWLLLALLPLVLLVFRRGVLVAVALLVTGGLATPRPALAWDWADLWQRSDQQGLAAVREGAPDRAAALFEDPHWRASALHWAGEHQAAAELFASQSGAEGHYNRGTALARAGDLDAAKAELQQALTLDPEHADARFNLELIERAEEQQRDQQQAGNEDAARQEQQQGQDQQQQMADQGQDSEQQQDGEPEDGAEDPDAAEQQRQAAQQEEQENGEQTQEQVALDNSEEAQRQREQAMEQWLRRVPDDPGGLLRRKFRHETRQRYQAGEARTRPDENPW